VELLGLEFRCQEFTWPVFSYHKWWRESDMSAAYRYHRRAAVLLQSQRPPNRWVSKAPYLCFHIDAIVAAYPDAKFVMTHRDPVKSIPSNMSFLASMLPPGVREAHDLTEFGPHSAEHLRVGLERAIESRKRIVDDRFLDVQHRHMTADPMGTLDRVYDFLQLELSGATRKAMEEWHEANRSGAHGIHQYSSEEFGLSDDRIRSDFAFYTSAFDIPLE
jgi:hypothetical protein